MDISKLSRRSDCGVTPNRTCASESKTKNNCGKVLCNLKMLVHFHIIL